MRQIISFVTSFCFLFSMAHAGSTAMPVPQLQKAPINLRANAKKITPAAYVNFVYRVSPNAKIFAERLRMSKSDTAEFNKEFKKNNLSMTEAMPKMVWSETELEANFKFPEQGVDLKVDKKNNQFFVNSQKIMITDRSNFTDVFNNVMTVLKKNHASMINYFFISEAQAFDNKTIAAVVIGVAAFFGLKALFTKFMENDINTDVEKISGASLAEIYENINALSEFTCVNNRLVKQKGDIEYGATFHFLASDYYDELNALAEEVRKSPAQDALLVVASKRKDIEEKYAKKAAELPGVKTFALTYNSSGAMETLKTDRPQCEFSFSGGIPRLIRGENECDIAIAQVKKDNLSREDVPDGLALKLGLDIRSANSCCRQTACVEKVPQLIGKRTGDRRKFLKRFERENDSQADSELGQQ